MRAAITFSLVVVGAQLTLLGDTYPRQPAVDALHYRFQLTLADEAARIEAEADVTLKLQALTRELALDFVTKTGDLGISVTAVTTAGRAVAYSHETNRLKLAVSADAKVGDELTYTIKYAGTPGDGLRALETVHGDRAIFSDNWPDRARHWLPMIDHPYDKATGEMIVIAPAQFQVVSNGRLVEELDLPNGQRRTHWHQSVPIASWLFALGVARFDVHHAAVVGGIPLQTWVFPQDRVRGRALFEETSRRALDFFSEHVGPYPYEKLANVQASGIGGGMENATAIFYGDKDVTAGRAPVVHEIAHQWFGNSVTERDWDDVWLSEGFATYFAHLYTEHVQGRDAFVRDLVRSRERVIEVEDQLPDTPVIHRNLSDMKRVLNQLVYQKAGWVLHMLRHEIGADRFWSGIRDYYRRYRDQNASTDDFRQVMEQASGKDLRWYFTQWFTRSGVPVVEGRWRFEPARQRVALTLQQTQPAEPYRLTPEIGIIGADGVTRVERVTLDSRENRFEFPASSKPSAVVIDPNTWLLARIGVLTDADGGSKEPRLDRLR
jgi:aminopeptidase N